MTENYPQIGKLRDSATNSKPTIKTPSKTIETPTQTNQFDSKFSLDQIIESLRNGNDSTANTDENIQSFLTPYNSITNATSIFSDDNAAELPTTTDNDVATTIVYNQPPPPSEDSNSVPIVSPSQPIHSYVLDHLHDGNDADGAAKIRDDIRHLSKLCNDLAFRFWESHTAADVTPTRTLFLSPFSLISTLAMLYLGARGNTSDELNSVLHLDDVQSSNPHQFFQSVFESIASLNFTQRNQVEFKQYLYSDRSNGLLLPFYKSKAFQYYGGIVEEINFADIREHIVGKMRTLDARLRDVRLEVPLASVATNIFRADCTNASLAGRNGEMNFELQATATRQQRLVRIPAVVWTSGFAVGYDPVLDVSAVTVASPYSGLSTIVVLPGQMGSMSDVPSNFDANRFARFETFFMQEASRPDAWTAFLKRLMHQPADEVQTPRFAHTSYVNATQFLKTIGLRTLLDRKASDLHGITGSLNNALHLSEIVQVNSFGICDSYAVEETFQHHSHYTNLRNASELENEQRMKQKLFVGMRTSRENSVPVKRLQVNRPFLYFVTHNETGIILYIGRFYPNIA